MTKTYVISISGCDKDQHFNIETSILASTMAKIILATRCLNEPCVL